MRADNLGLVVSDQKNQSAYEYSWDDEDKSVM